MKKKKRFLLISIVLLGYLGSYAIFRKCYETREGEFITLYDEDSVISLLAYLIHTPLIHADTAFTGREVKVGNWREPLSPEAMRELEERRNSANEVEE